MSQMDRLLERGGNQRGYVLASDAEELGVPTVELRKLASRGRLERAGHGIYRFPHFPRRVNDDLMEAVLWTGKRGVIAGEAALGLHDLCDANPQKIEIAVPREYNPRKAGGAFYRVIRTKLLDDQITEVDDIPVLEPETAIRFALSLGTDPALIRQSIISARRLLLVSEQEAEQLVNQLRPRSGRAHE